VGITPGGRGGGDCDGATVSVTAGGEGGWGDGVCWLGCDSLIPVAAGLIELSECSESGGEGGVCTTVGESGCGESWPTSVTDLSPVVNTDKSFFFLASGDAGASCCWSLDITPPFLILE
jgi:hypothetical protein